ncbi:MAG: HAD-IIB family hydrolase [Thermoanaerobaculia bacterium]|nr:HAD-IIB family hydrolase [Thermoanaerobaculia bacterium]
MSDGLYLALFSIHGLVRGEEPELGRDPDTGGQVTYVLELTRALAERAEVERVDLITRRIFDDEVSDQYAEPVETLAPGTRLIRVEFGPREYLRKEDFWPYLDECEHSVLRHFREVGRVPDLLHSHYADAGRLGARLSRRLQIPLVHTGHSLGRIKRERLLDAGSTESQIERRFNISTRIQAEEEALEAASTVVTSTHQEAEEQWARYDAYEAGKMAVIPPGVSLDRFQPPDEDTDEDPPIRTTLLDFLRDPNKPMILALARPDPRKNIPCLVEAYGNAPDLQEEANLVLVLGTREDVRETDRESQKVFQKVFTLIDVHDLHGLVAYPKQHEPDDVPDLYRLAVGTGGVFVNPALTEPFGLTLIEAAASGLPVVATNDGGPRDILHYCDNGLLVDPLDPDDIADALREALSDPERWERWSKNGIEGVRRRFSWSTHVEEHLERVRPFLGASEPPPHIEKIFHADRLLVTDLDGTLLGDRETLQQLLERMDAASPAVVFGIATGRRLESARRALEEWSVPSPDVLITAVGSEIHYGLDDRVDEAWIRHIEKGWDREALERALEGTPGLRLQAPERQRRFKLSYHVDPEAAPDLQELRDRLAGEGLETRLIFSHDEFLDLLPQRASKGQAIAFLASRWGFPPSKVLVAGDSGNDADMLTGEVLGTVVGNYSPELEALHRTDTLYFATAPYAGGILEGIDHFEFL